MSVVQSGSCIAGGMWAVARSVRVGEGRNRARVVSLGVVGWVLMMGVRREEGGGGGGGSRW